MHRQVRLDQTISEEERTDRAQILEKYRKAKKTN